MNSPIPGRRVMYSLAYNTIKTLKNVFIELIQVSSSPYAYRNYQYLLT